jgi:hypothetical protein
VDLPRERPTVTGVSISNLAPIAGDDGLDSTHMMEYDAHYCDIPYLSGCGLRLPAKTMNGLTTHR